MDIGPFNGILVGVVVTVLTIVLSAPYIRQRRKQATVELKAETISLLRSELEVETATRVAQQARCDKEISELRGEIKALRRDYAKEIGVEVVSFLRNELSR